MPSRGAARTSFRPKSDSRKSNGKQCEHRQQFPHEIHLQRNQRCQEHPHPLSTLVLGLHLPSCSRSRSPLDLTLALNLCFALSVFRHLLRCSTLSQSSEAIPRTCPI